jgi:hypothetical protein
MNSRCKQIDEETTASTAAAQSSSSKQQQQQQLLPVHPLLAPLVMGQGCRICTRFVVGCGAMLLSLRVFCVVVSDSRVFVTCLVTTLISKADGGA